MHKVTVSEAKIDLPKLIKEAISGEDVFIMKNKHLIIKLVPLSPSKPKPLFGSAKGLIQMSDDFDEPLQDFKEYTQ